MCIIRTFWCQPSLCQSTLSVYPRDNSVLSNFCIVHFLLKVDLVWHMTLIFVTFHLLNQDRNDKATPRVVIADWKGQGFSPDLGIHSCAHKSHDNHMHSHHCCRSTELPRTHTDVFFFEMKGISPATASKGCTQLYSTTTMCIPRILPLAYLLA
jgi:hypothetical protein